MTESQPVEKYKGQKWIEGHDADGNWTVTIPEIPSKFLDFLVDPDPNKGSEASWARAHGVNVNRLPMWKKKLPFRREWEKRLADLNISPGRIQDVVDAMWQNAARGDVRSAQLYLQYIDKLSPTKVVFVDKGVAELSDDELQARLAAFGKPKLVNE